MTSAHLDPELIPEGRTLVDDKPFLFHCHPAVSCFMHCCRQLELYLYPYDVLRLKNALRMHSADFMREHTLLARGSHPFFPAVMLKMADNEEHTCPFLLAAGCSVYEDRPSACRTYPLERAVEKRPGAKQLTIHYFMTHHPYCQGHTEHNQYTLAQWERDQFLHEFNLMNDQWAEVDALFASNPWQGEGSAGPRQQLAFMVCFNIDDFRDYCRQHILLKRFALEKDRRRRIERYDAELLKFGFDWLLFVLGGRPTLRPR